MELRTRRNSWLEQTTHHQSWRMGPHIIIIRMELAHFGREEIQIFFKKADFFRPVVQEFLITL